MARALRSLRPPRLSAFILAVLAWLPLTFAVWYFAAPLLLWPAVLAMQGICATAFAYLVRSVEQVGSNVVFTTVLRPGTGLSGAFVSVDVNLLLYSFGLPLYAALVLAAKEPGWPRRLFIGYAVLIPFVAWGALADFLKSIAITMGPKIASQTGFVAWQREAIAFSYQFGALILPTVVPLVMWVVTHRALLERLRSRSRTA